MAKTISRYVQLDDAILMEYVINKESNNNADFVSSFSETKPIVMNVASDKNRCGYARLLVDTAVDSPTRNDLQHLAVPVDATYTDWYRTDFNKTNISKNYQKHVNSYGDFLRKDKDGNAAIEIPATGSDIIYDKVKLHILSGYSFSNVYGIMLKVKTKDNSGNEIYLANWVYTREQKGYTYEDLLIINNRCYDKYIEFLVPSMFYFRNIVTSKYRADAENKLLDTLNIRNSETVSDIQVVYSVIPADMTDGFYDTSRYDTRYRLGTVFNVDDNITVSIPYDSPADNFNIMLKESSDGDYVKFCGTWDDYPITYSVINSLNTRIKIYSSTGHHMDDDYLYYADQDMQSNWVIFHEITTSLYSNGDNAKPIYSEKYTVTQDFNLNPAEKTVFYYSPVLANVQNAIDADFITFDYTARLVNRYDGNQIVRTGSLTSYNISRYVRTLDRINPAPVAYNIYNKIVENRQELTGKEQITPQTKYVKTFYDVSEIAVETNTGSGTQYIQQDNFVLRLYRNTRDYKFRFVVTDPDTKQTRYADLNDIMSYELVYRDENGLQVTIPCTYSENMNLSLGEVEFTVSSSNSAKMRLVPAADRWLAIVVHNIDNSVSTLFECKYGFLE